MTAESDDAAPAGPAVRLRGVSKRFGWTRALTEVDMEVARGELVALTGPNGAGKTTLLRIVATLAAPTRGEVTVLGRPAGEHADAVRRRTGYLPARGYLYDGLTALENLRFASLMSGVRDWEEPARRVLDRVGLRAAGDRRVRGFSSGMRRRLALARLLLRPPELALLDEPYASLDPDGVRLVDEVVEEMHGRGAAVLAASQQWGRCLEAADRVVVLRRGELAWEGTPEEHAAGEGPATPDRTEARPPPDASSRGSGDAVGDRRPDASG